MTLEIWATITKVSSDAWGKFYTWGQSTERNVSITMQGNTQFTCSGPNGRQGNTSCFGDMYTGSETGREYYFVMTLKPNGKGGTLFKFRRFNSDKKEEVLYDYDIQNWLVNDIEQEFFKLGWSVWGNNALGMEVNEIRIWDAALTDLQIKRHVQNGPDNLSDEETTVSVRANEPNIFGETVADSIKEKDYLLHRWTFNRSLEDSAGSSDATIKGNASFTQTGTGVHLPGGSRNTSWIDMGDNGGIPVDDTPFTIEAWVYSHNQSKSWTRMFSFGKRKRKATHSVDPAVPDSLYSGLFFSYKGNGKRSIMQVFDHGTMKLDIEACNNDGVGQGYLSENTECHVAFTFIPDSATGNTEYRIYGATAANGTRMFLRSGIIEGWLPSRALARGETDDDNGDATYNWLGLSQWNDSDANATFNEFRIWNCALSEKQLEINRQLGPDKLPVLTKVNKERTFDADISDGATLNFGGNTLSMGTISGKGAIVNASAIIVGDINPGGKGVVGELTLNGNVVVTGTINLDVGDKIVVNGSLDLSLAKVVLSNSSKDFFCFASTTDGVIGTPALADKYNGLVIKTTSKDAWITFEGLKIKVR